MKLLHEAICSKKFDVRLIERNLAQEAISQLELDQKLQSLPDEQTHGEWISFKELMQDSKDRQ